MKNIFIQGKDGQDRVAIAGFDFDGNIVSPNTITYVIDRITGNEVGIPAHVLDQNPSLISGKDAIYRWKDDIIDSLIHFRDFHPDSRHLGPEQLKKDTLDALERGAYSPSFESLKNTFLIPARLTAIITARGHEPGNIIRILGMINEAILTKDEKRLQHENINNIYNVLHQTSVKLHPDQALRYYFEHIVGCYPVSNAHTARYLQMNQISSMAVRKTIAMQHYIYEVTNTILITPELKAMPKSFGFSDDAIGNIIAMLDFFRSKKVLSEHQNDTFNLYFTGKKEEMDKIITPDLNIETRSDMSVIRI